MLHLLLGYRELRESRDAPPVKRFLRLRQLPDVATLSRAVREVLPGVIVEVRMDSALFSDEIVMALQEARIEFTVSVPFKRFVALKKSILGRLQTCPTEDIPRPIPGRVNL